MTLHDLIKTKREAMGLTQEQLATLLGKNRTTVTKYETGKVKFKNINAIKKLSSVLKIPLKEFLR